MRSEEKSKQNNNGIFHILISESALQSNSIGEILVSFSFVNKIVHDSMRNQKTINHFDSIRFTDFTVQLNFSICLRDINANCDSLFFCIMIKQFVIDLGFRFADFAIHCTRLFGCRSFCQAYTCDVLIIYRKSKIE